MKYISSFLSSPPRNIRGSLLRTTRISPSLEGAIHHEIHPFHWWKIIIGGVIHTHTRTRECSKIFLLRTLEALYRTIIEFRIIFPLGSRFSRCKSWRCNRVTSLVHQARPTFVPNFLFSLPSPFRKKSKIIIRQLNSIFRKLLSID